MNKKRNISFVLLASLILAQSLYAKNESSILPKVIVTAQKQEENISDIPLSISYYNELEIMDRGIENIEDIGKFTSSFTFMSNGTRGASTPSMRGIHAEIQTYQLSTGIYIDGVPSLNALTFDTLFDDIESIQVLKGPQSTLYGKNAEVGAIVIKTKQPGNEVEGKIQLTLGTDSKQELRAKISGPIIEDKLFLGFSINHDKKNGVMKQKSTGKIIDNREHKFYKLNLRATPSDNLEISLMSSYSKYNDGASRRNIVLAKDSRIADVDLLGYNKSTANLNSLKIGLDLSASTSIESITAISRMQEDSIFDGDVTASAASAFHTHRKSKHKSFSQEFRLNQEFDKFKYVLGVDFTTYDVNYDVEVLKYSIYYNNIDTKSKIEDKSKGIFSHLTYDVTDKISLTAGFRYEKEEKNLKDEPNMFFPNPYSGKEKYSSFTPKLALDYKISDNNLLYGSISKGFRPGGFNDMRTPDKVRTYAQESLISYEIGNKLAFNNLSINTAIYLMKIKDMQVLESISPTEFFTSNAAEATSKGIEIDLNYNINYEINFFTSLSLNETKFDDFKDSFGDYSNNYSPNAPRYNYNVGLQYRGNEYFARVDLNGEGKTYAEKKNVYSRKAFQTVDLKLGYEKKTFDIYLYTKNLFDKKYDFVGYFGGEYTVLSEPREIGVTMTYRF